MKYVRMFNEKITENYITTQNLKKRKSQIPSGMWDLTTKVGTFSKQSQLLATLQLC